MNRITFFGSGVEREDVRSDMPEVDPVVRLLADHYDEFRFGGTNVGLVGRVGTAAKDHGLDVIPILPRWLAEEHEEIVFDSDSTVLTDDLATRRLKLSDTDAIICYPGGVGTFDELFEVLARISLNEIESIPVLVYNYERFYSPILLQIEHGIKTGTIKEHVQECIYTFEQVQTLREILQELE